MDASINATGALDRPTDVGVAAAYRIVVPALTGIVDLILRARIP